MSPGEPASAVEAAGEQHIGSTRPPAYRLVIYGGLLVLAIVILVILPPLLNGFQQLLMTKFLILAIFGMGYNLVYGYGGMLSLGHGAFFGIGVYAVGLLWLHTGINNLWLSIPVSIIMALVGGLILSFFFLRMSGVYFLLITFGLSQLLYAMAWSIDWFNSSGMQGISDIKYPSIGFSGFNWTNITFYYLVLVFFVICYFLIKKIIDSPFGHAVVGVREGEKRMQVLGYNVWLTRYIVLVISAGFCGLAGMLFAYNNSFAHPTHLGFDYSWVPMLIVIVGGAGTKLGPIIGAMIVVWLEYFVSTVTPYRWPLFMGIFFVAVIMYFRGGVVLWISRALDRMARRRATGVGDGSA